MDNAEVDLADRVGIVVDQADDALGVRAVEGDFLFDFAGDALEIGVFAQMGLAGILAVDVTADAYAGLGMQPGFPAFFATDILEHLATVVEDAIRNDLLVAGILFGGTTRQETIVGLIEQCRHVPVVFGTQTMEGSKGIKQGAGHHQDMFFEHRNNGRLGDCLPMQANARLVNQNRIPEVAARRKIFEPIPSPAALIVSMPTPTPAAQIVRRDLLKSVGMGMAATVLAGTRGFAETLPAPTKKVRGIIFMVSDGMSPGVLTMAEAYSKLTRKRGTRWWQLLNDRAAACGLMDTASASSMVTDSAAAASAWGGGQRVTNGVINMDASGREIPPIAAILKQKCGARIGLVTTATVTHATPAGFAASIPARGDENSIAPQYLDRVDVILGGGSGFFDPAKRPDKRDLAGDFTKAGYQIIGNRDSLLAARGEKLLGTFTRGHLPFSIDRDNDEIIARKIPTLTEMADAALSRFLAGDKPFLLQIEGARIDHAAHLNDIAGLLGDQLAFDDALAAVMAKIAGRDDILVVVTSDHGNANPGLNGTGNAYGESTPRFARIQRMKSSHENIFAQWAKIPNGTTGQLTGLVRQHLDFDLHAPEAEALLAILTRQPVIEWSHQLEKPEGLLGQIAGNHTGIGWTGTSHTSDPTVVTAIGPQADRFAGIVINTAVFTHLLDVLG